MKVNILIANSTIQANFSSAEFESTERTTLLTDEEVHNFLRSQ